MRINPAPNHEVAIYLPYYPPSRRPFLSMALGLYKQSSLEGRRRIEGGDGLGFVATWGTKSLPSDVTECRVKFLTDEQTADYEVSLQNVEFLGYLIEMVQSIESGNPPDFPQSFYRKLLGF
ncbi:MAG: type IV pilus biogenesis protein EbsA [Gloeobacterales cyanobacterium]